MKNSHIFAIFLIGLILAFGCQPSPPKNTVQHLKLQQQWFANSGFAGEVWASKETAQKYGLTLEVLPGSDQIDTKQVVKLGAADIGVAGAEQVLQANEKGADFVVIGVINYKTLACFISKKDKGITKPSDFVGHKIGTMEGSPVDLVYQALKKREGLQIPKTEEVPTGWVLTGFTRGQYDVYPAFINDEPIKLGLEGMKLNVVKPSDYGVDFIGTVYFCKRSLVEKSPEAIQAFISAVADGWKAALANPDQAIAYLKDYDKNIDTKKELASLKDSVAYYEGEQGKLLYCSEESWSKMAGLLKDIGAIQQPFSYALNVENRFVDAYAEGKAKK